MTPITINDKPYSIPSSWNEVTVRQWMALRYANKLSGIIAVLADLPINDILHSSEVDLDDRLWPMLEWYTKAPDWKNLKPKPFLFVRDRALRIPDNLGYSTYEQVENLKTYFNEEIQTKKNDDFASMIVPAVAMWAQPEYDKSAYDEYRAKEMEKELMESSIMEVYPLATFFFRKHLGLQSLNTGPLKSGLRMKIITMLKGRLLKSLNRLEALARYTNSPKEIRQSSTKSSNWNTT